MEERLRKDAAKELAEMERRLTLRFEGVMTVAVTDITSR